MKGGRPTKLTPDVQDRIVRLLRAGNYIETAAAFCDIDKPTLYAWLKRGNRQRKGIFREFLNAVDAAQAEAEIRDLEVIRKEGAWQGAAWRLERKFPRRWGRHDRLDIGELPKPVVLDLVTARDDSDDSA